MARLCLWETSSSRSTCGRCGSKGRWPRSGRARSRCTTAAGRGVGTSGSLLGSGGCAGSRSGPPSRRRRRAFRLPRACRRRIAPLARGGTSLTCAARGESAPRACARRSRSRSAPPPSAPPPSPASRLPSARRRRSSTRAKRRGPIARRQRRGQKKKPLRGQAAGKGAEGRAEGRACPRRWCAAPAQGRRWCRAPLPWRAAAAAAAEGARGSKGAHRQEEGAAAAACAPSSSTALGAADDAAASWLAGRRAGCGGGRGDGPDHGGNLAHPRVGAGRRGGGRQRGGPSAGADADAAAARVPCAAGGAARATADARLAARPRREPVADAGRRRGLLCPAQHGLQALHVRPRAGR